MPATPADRPAEDATPLDLPAFGDAQDRLRVDILDKDALDAVLREDEA